MRPRSRFNSWWRYLPLLVKQAPTRGRTGSGRRLVSLNAKDVISANVDRRVVPVGELDEFLCLGQRRVPLSHHLFRCLLDDRMRLVPDKHFRELCHAGNLAEARGTVRVSELTATSTVQPMNQGDPLTVGSPITNLVYPNPLTHPIRWWQSRHLRAEVREMRKTHAYLTASIKDQHRAEAEALLRNR